MNDKLETWEAARLLGVSQFTITNKYIPAGLLPAEKVNTHTGRGHTKWLIRRSDVESLRARRLAGEFKPGPEGQNKGMTLMYFPRPAEWGSEIKAVLSGEERAVILAHYARMRENNPVWFEEQLSRMNG